LDEDVQECAGVGGVGSQVSLSEISHHCLSWSSRRAVTALRCLAMAISPECIEHGTAFLRRTDRVLSMKLVGALLERQAVCVSPFKASTSRYTR
jgi:hypothetical protein